MKCIKSFYISRAFSKIFAQRTKAICQSHCNFGTKARFSRSRSFVASVISRLFTCVCMCQRVTVGQWVSNDTFATVSDISTSQALEVRQTRILVPDPDKRTYVCMREYVYREVCQHRITESAHNIPRCIYTKINRMQRMFLHFEHERIICTACVCDKLYIYINSYHLTFTCDNDSFLDNGDGNEIWVSLFN